MEQNTVIISVEEFERLRAIEKIYNSKNECLVFRYDSNLYNSYNTAEEIFFIRGKEDVVERVMKQNKVLEEQIEKLKSDIYVQKVEFEEKQMELLREKAKIQMEAQFSNKTNEKEQKPKKKKWWE